jgi:ribosomal protein L30E
LKNENLVLGSDRVLKLLREGQLERVFLASNAPAAPAADIKRFASLRGVTLEVLGVPNDELGVMCKKPFSIAAIGMKKAAAAGKKQH